MDAVVAKVSESAEKHQDHEIRIRALELTSATMAATNGTAKGLAQWGWMALFTLINTAISAATFIIKGVS